MQIDHLATVIWEKSKFSLKSEASTNYLSYSWWFLEPVLQMACYYVVFEVLLGRGGPGYVYFLLAGLVPWLWFARAINQSTNSLVAGSGLMNQLSIPKIFFPAVVIVQTTVKQCLTFVVFLVFLFLIGKPVTAQWLALPILVIVQISIIIPCSLLAAISVVYVKDLKHVIPTGVQFLFFFSGIFYDISRISEKYQAVVLLNPMAGLVQAYRQIFLFQEYPNWQYLSFVLVFGILFSAFIVLTYKNLDQKIARLVQE